MYTQKFVSNRRSPFTQTRSPGDISDHIVFVQSVSIAGSIYTQSIASALDLNQWPGDFYSESINDALSFIQEFTGVKNTGQVVSNMLILTQENMLAGGRLFHSLESTHTATFNSNATIGQPLYVVNNSQVDLAIADNATKTHVAGFSIDDILAGEVGNYVTEGYIERSDWTAITGSANLTPGSIYYLDPNTVGLLTDTSPITSGDYVVKVGRAINQTQLSIEIEAPILL